MARRSRTATRGRKSRDRRKALAESLAKVQAHRTPKAQIDRLNKAGHAAKRERARLEAQL